MAETGIIVGDAREELAKLPAGHFHCCVTSPPYWALRDYGVPGQIGLEAMPDEYIQTLVEVFREVRRVLRPDACLFLNLGDSYAGGGGYAPDAPCNQKRAKGEAWGVMNPHSQREGLARQKAKPGYTPPGLKPKDLCMIPARVALALQADGWWLRSAMPWVKRSPMPESCTDRPTSALEYVFLLTPSARYFWDMEAVRQKAAQPLGEPEVSRTQHKQDAMSRRLEASTLGTNYGPAGRAFRNTDLYFASLKEPHGLICVGDEPVGLDVVSEAFKEAHFATFPRRLVEPPIKAGTSEKGCCPACGAPWVRIVDKDRKATRPGRNNVNDPTGMANRNPYRHVTETRTKGWEPGCECTGKFRHLSVPHMAKPCRVLDPFAGAATVGVVCKQLGRDFTGIELNPAYAEMGRKRIECPEPLPEIVDVDGQETFSFLET